jgi:hypothetical protein
MISLDDLPNEILCQIMSYLEGRRKYQPLLKSLCLASRRIRAVTEPVLYSYFNDGIQNERSPILHFNSRCRSFLRSILKRPELAKYTRRAIVGPWYTFRNDSPNWFDTSAEDLALFHSAASRFGLDKSQEWLRQLAKASTEEAELYLLICSLQSLESLTLNIPDRPASYWWSQRMPRIHTMLWSVTIVAPKPSFDTVSMLYGVPRCPIPDIFSLPSLQSLTLSGCNKDSELDNGEGHHLWDTSGLSGNSTVNHLDIRNAALIYSEIRDIFKVSPHITSFSYDRGYKHGDCLTPKQILRLLYPFHEQLQRLEIRIDKEHMTVPPVRNDFTNSNRTGIHEEQLSLYSYTKLTHLFLDLFVVTGPVEDAEIIHEDVLVRFLPSNLQSLRIVNDAPNHQKALRKLELHRQLLFPHLKQISNLGGFKMVNPLLLPPKSRANIRSKLFDNATN